LPFIYALSDIHGCLEPFDEKLKLVDLSHKESKLILCGDYIDYGKDSCKVLYRVKELVDQYPNQVIALLGNHEYMFIEFLNSKDRSFQAVEWLKADREFLTVNSFISAETKSQIMAIICLYGDSENLSTFEKIGLLVKKNILEEHQDLIK